LWATSCFPFESTYHFLVKMIHGTLFVLHQVRSFFSFFFFFFFFFSRQTKQTKHTHKQTAQLRHSAYAFRQVKVLSQEHLIADQQAYVEGIGGKITSGHYVTERAPEASRVLEIEASSFVLGGSKATLVTPTQTQEIRALWERRKTRWSCIGGGPLFEGRRSRATPTHAP